MTIRLSLIVASMPVKAELAIGGAEMKRYYLASKIIETELMHQR